MKRRLNKRNLIIAGAYYWHYRFSEYGRYNHFIDTFSFWNDLSYSLVPDLYIRKD